MILIILRSDNISVKESNVCIENQDGNSFIQLNMQDILHQVEFEIFAQ